MTRDPYDPERRIDPEDEARRKRAQVPLAELVDLDLPKLSEEEWAERDAAVARARAAHRDLEARTQARPDLDQFGWRPRELKHARSSMRTLACDVALAHDFRDRCILVLEGPKGVGKTVAAARWALARPSITWFVSSSKFARTSRYTNGEKHDEWASSAGLVLDDLGREFIDAKGSFLVDLDELIDTRYAEMRPLIITTNCKAEVFAERYGARIFDRVVEAGRWETIQGESLR